MRKKQLQVTLEVREPSVVELTVHERVQLDRLVEARTGQVAQRRGELLDPGVTTLALAQGHYFFKTLSEASLRVVSGGVQAVTTNGTKTIYPDPPMTANSAGDELDGEAPAFVIA